MIADVFSIAGALKRKGIKQCDVVKTLSQKYNLNLSTGLFSRYAQQCICGDTDRWLTIRECLANDFGVHYKPTYWT